VANKSEAHEIIESLKAISMEGGADVVTRPARQTLLVARLQVLLAEEQEKSAAKLERQTNKLILLTWAIVGLTAALLYFTAVLYRDSHHTSDAKEPAQAPATKQP
jgi:hypothetical protein